MTRTAQELLDDVRAELAPDPSANPLVPRLADGTADPSVITALALEQRSVIPADRRSFAHLAARSAASGAPGCADFFRGLTEGETLAFDRLGALVTACGVDKAAAEAYEPRAGCQAYPAYVAWLALNGEPVDVVLALTANFAAWGGYCATLAQALPAHYGFSDEACAFFAFFAEPAPDLERQALAAVQEGLDRGPGVTGQALRHGKLLQRYEAMFWETLAAPTDGAR
ncbi:transcriptional regulator [Streptomyces sp. NBC_01381]|uniref:transcriptional regulator n=1 Tax=Streptomyces sp. NBC_01381 TaxID=2903845 RepID=UPI00224F85C9|nr:transcriptional regulator [Streptomyces sp. NBC_01381]MCX4668870.1 transcriptional regulator [Streptomyces sp. NBC_01381]